MIVILMGVSGSGKSTIGHSLSQQLSWLFEDGDDYHPESNRIKMSAGIPLNDEDRYQWLLNLHDVIDRWQSTKQHGIIVCSALKLKYRRVLSCGRTAQYLDTNVRVPPLLVPDPSLRGNVPGVGQCKEEFAGNPVTKEASVGCSLGPSTASMTEALSGATDMTNINAKFVTKEVKSCEDPATTTRREQTEKDVQLELAEENREQCDQCIEGLSQSQSRVLQQQSQSTMVLKCNHTHQQQNLTHPKQESIERQSPSLVVSSQEDGKERVVLKPEVTTNKLIDSDNHDHHHSSQVLFVHLRGSPDLISARLSQRKGHFFNPKLLQSQFDTLEELGSHENGIIIDIGKDKEFVVSEIAAQILHLLE